MSTLKLTRWQRFRRVPSLARLILFSFFCMFGSVVGLGGGLLALEFNLAEPPRGAVNPTGPEPVGQIKAPNVFKDYKRLNILVLGIDYNHDEKSILYTAGARSDSIMVVSLSSDAQIVNVVSIPRDLYVPLSEAMGSDRINAAFSYGGVKQARETVSHFLGIPIHHFLIVKVYGAKKIVDAMGGLRLDVEKDMDYDDNWGQLHVHLKKGPQTLNGEQAVGYARFRKDNVRIDLEGDVGRMRRQQQVVRALARTLKDVSIIGKIPELAKAVKDTLETDLGIQDMIELASYFRRFETRKIRGGQIVGLDDIVNEAMVLVPLEAENNQTVRSLLKDSLDFGLSDIRVRILNCTGQPGLGNQVADELTAQGFNVVDADDNEGKPVKKTQIVVYTKCPRVQQRLRAQFPGAQLRDSASPNPNYDITITLGSDRGFLAKHPKSEPPSASRWGLPEAPKPQPLPVEKPAPPPTPLVEPAPLPTPSEPDAESLLRSHDVTPEPAQG